MGSGLTQKVAPGGYNFFKKNECRLSRSATHLHTVGQNFEDDHDKFSTEPESLNIRVFYDIKSLIPFAQFVKFIENQSLQLFGWENERPEARLYFLCPKEPGTG